jgi:hypothetical protein
MNPNTIPNSNENQENAVNEWENMTDTGEESTGVETGDENAIPYIPEGLPEEFFSANRDTGEENMTGMENGVSTGTETETGE